MKENATRRAAEHAHAADRYAREIVRYFGSCCGALAAADGQAVSPQFYTAPNTKCLSFEVFSLYGYTN